MNYQAILDIVDPVLRKSIINADVIIITLGLIETWVDKNKKKAWHCFHGNPIKKISVENLAEFKQLNFNYRKKRDNPINRV